MPIDELTRLKKRQTWLRVLTQSAKGVDFDFVKNYATKKASKNRNYIKIKNEVHSPKRHKLIEELALTTLFLSKCKNVLEPQEVDLLQMYENYPDEEILHFIKSEWDENWNREELRKQVLKIKRKLGSHNEKIESKSIKKKYEKPILISMIDEKLKTIKEDIFGRSK